MTTGQGDAAELTVLREAVRTLAIPARRYTDGAATYATADHNRTIRALLALGLFERMHWPEGTPWARDRMGRAYDGLSDAEAAQGTPPNDFSALAREERQAIEARVAARYEVEIASLRPLGAAVARWGEALVAHQAAERRYRDTTITDEGYFAGIRDAETKAVEEFKALRALALARATGGEVGW